MRLMPVLHFGMHGTVEWLPGAPLGNNKLSLLLLHYHCRFYTITKICTEKLTHVTVAWLCTVIWGVFSIRQAAALSILT